MRSQRLGLPSLRAFWMGIQELIQALLNVYPRRLTVVLVTALSLKIGFMAWNATQFDIARSYDPGMHAARTLSCGLYTDGRFYNPPLYYLASCPVTLVGLLFQIDLINDVIKPLSEGSSPSALTQKFDQETDILTVAENTGGPFFLRILNVLMISIVFAIWVFFLFPRYLGHGLTAFTASIFILSLPSYQKIAAMINPDNALIFGTTLAFLLYINIIDRRNFSLKEFALIGCVLGVFGLTRPFALAPMVCIGAGLMFSYWRYLGYPLSLTSLRPVFTAGLVLAMIVIPISGGWWVYRHAVTGNALTLYRDGKERNITDTQSPEITISEYYTNFYAEDLLAEPNRYLGETRVGIVSGESEYWRKTYNNSSFLTPFFSDFWADHWLYFSSNTPRIEANRVPKQMLLAYGLLLTPILLCLAIVGTIRFGSRMVKGTRPEEHGVILGITALGIMLYLFWQGLLAFEPGNNNNSSVKFIYIAHLVPFLTVLIFSGGLRGRLTKQILVTACALLFVLGLPLSLYRW